MAGWQTLETATRSVASQLQPEAAAADLNEEDQEEEEDQEFPGEDDRQRDWRSRSRLAACQLKKPSSAASQPSVGSAAASQLSLVEHAAAVSQSAQAACQPATEAAQHGASAMQRSPSPITQQKLIVNIIKTSETYIFLN